MKKLILAIVIAVIQVVNLNAQELQLENIENKIDNSNSSKIDYSNLFDSTVWPALREVDAIMPYWPASPSNVATVRCTALL